MKSLFAILLASTLLMPGVAAAQTPDCSKYGPGFAWNGVTCTLGGGSTTQTPVVVNPGSGSGTTQPFCNGKICTYTPLEPFGNIGSGGYPTIQSYLQSAFTILITLGALFAVTMLTLSGIRYMLSESFTDKSKALGRIRSSMLGLLLLVASWLILYTINPNLLKFNLNIPNTPTFAPSSTPTQPTTPCGTNANGCSADQYCGMKVGSFGTDPVATCIPKTEQDADKRCADIGGSWTSGLTGNYCYLKQYETKEACHAAGGQWSVYWFSLTQDTYCWKNT